MTEILSEPLDSPAAWRADDFQSLADIRQPFSVEEIDDLRQALAGVRGRDPLTLTKADFPLPVLGARLEALRRELEGGRGFGLFSGLPVQDWSEQECATALWGLGLYVGTAMPQDKAGALIHHVRDTGQSTKGAANVRGFQTDEELDFHNDGADVFMLLCRKTAPEGGVSRLASAVSAFNEVCRRRPDLAEVLQQPFHFDARAQSPWDDKLQSIPIFTYHAGYLNALYKRGYITLAQRFDDTPPLTTAQTEALDLLDAILREPGFSLQFELEPGDLEVGNNFTTFHARTKYVDAEDPAERRHMLRLWLSLPDGRALPPEFARTREFGPTYALRNSAN